LLDCWLVRLPFLTGKDWLQDRVVTGQGWSQDRTGYFTGQDWVTELDWLLNRTSYRAGLVIGQNWFQDRTGWRAGLVTGKELFLEKMVAGRVSS
jgi:hypothetical protein